MELQSEHNFGVRVTGKIRGRTGLKVVLGVTDPKAGQLVGNQQELRDEIQIQVHHCGYYTFIGINLRKAVFLTLYLCVLSTNIINI